MLKVSEIAGTLAVLAGVLQLSSGAALAAAANGANFISKETVVTAPRTSDRRIARVSYADLNVGSASGMRTLHGRIKSAVIDVCGSYASMKDLPNYLEQRSCRDRAWQDAESQLNDMVNRQRVASR